MNNAFPMEKFAPCSIQEIIYCLAHFHRLFQGPDNFSDVKLPAHSRKKGKAS